MTTVGQVTGRRYTRTRVRGNAAWKPKAETRALVDLVRCVIAEYEEPLTLRQVFYRLVGAHGYEKTETASARLGEYLNRARRAGLLPWESFRDYGDIVPNRPGWPSAPALISAIRDSVENYVRTPEGETYVEVWVETAGMLPQMHSVADRFGVRETYQAEVLDPSTLAELVRSRLLELIGEDVLDRAAAQAAARGDQAEAGIVTTQSANQFWFDNG